MFRILNNSYNKLSNVTDIEKDDVLFSGFDGNEEPSHYIPTSIAIYPNM